MLDKMFATSPLVIEIGHQECEAPEVTTRERSERWTVGDITITNVVEAQTDQIPPEFFFPAATAEAVRVHEWVVPTWADEQGRIGLRVQALVVETPTRRVLVDPCVGNGKSLTLPFWNDQHWPFLERLGAAGFDPTEIDLVVHTHLHEDHVGWDTHLVGAEWIPTFPNARHLYIRTALDAWASSVDNPDRTSVLRESIQPILDAGLADVIDEPTDAPLDLGEGLSLVATPGHCEGHVSLWIERDGQRLLITGDFVHHPVQLSEPAWAEIADIDTVVSEATRRRMFAEAERTGALVIGTHFPTASAGRVVAHGEAWRFEHQPGSPVDDAALGAAS